MQQQGKGTGVPLSPAVTVHQPADYPTEHTAPPDLLDSLLQKSQHSFTAEYPKGAQIFWKGDLPRGVFLIQAGRVKLFEVHPSGRTLTHALTGAREPLGLGSLLLNQPHLYSAETLELSRITFVPKGEFFRVLDSDASLLRSVLLAVGMQLHECHLQLSRLAATPTVPAKIARLLLDFAQASHNPLEDGARVSLNLTHQQIGDLVACSRETVSRALKEFRAQGLVEVQNATFVLQDVGQLLNIART